MFFDSLIAILFCSKSECFFFIRIAWHSVLGGFDGELALALAAAAANFSNSVSDF